jgi:hypothetical protein
VADEPEEKPEGEAPAEELARETAVGHQVVEAAETPQSAADAPQPAAAPPTPPSGTSPAGADRLAAQSHDQFEQKPEVFIAGAFVGAFVFGKLLKKMTGSDD